MRASELEAAFATLPPAWDAVLPGWTNEKRRAVCDAVLAASGDKAIAPEDPFRALRLVDPAAVRVVVIGQDPYPTAGHADGLAFSALRLVGAVNMIDSLRAQVLNRLPVHQSDLGQLLPSPTGALDGVFRAAGASR